ncbi:hypothetical protein F5Y10DRAFT_291639 [Nemania abortiva]|nr:hypothetical protein F5Y10DRAFT_291639 [Nemania abortiva]
MAHQQGPGTPFAWTPPEAFKESVMKTISSVLFNQSETRSQTVRFLVYYRWTEVSFDDSLKAHEVHPAFWIRDAPRVRMITVMTSQGDDKTQSQCFDKLHKLAIEHNIKGIAVRFGGFREPIYGPRFFRVGDNLIEVKEETKKELKETSDTELLRAKLQILKSQAASARNEEDRRWFADSQTLIVDAIQRKEEIRSKYKR